MANQLPIVKIDGKHFFVDERLKEYRETINPHNRIKFEELGDREVESIETKKNLKPKQKKRLR